MAEHKYPPSETAPPYPTNAEGPAYPMAQQPYPPPQYPQQYGQQTQYNQQYGMGQQYPPQPVATNTSTTTVTTAPTTVVITRNRSSSPTGMDIAGLALAIWNTFCCFMPIGIASLIISIVAFVFRCDGRYDEADKLSKVSVILSVVGLILGVVFLIVIIVYFMVIANDVNNMDY
ncbi:uncharacterized protein LOC144436544 [Glandiceps talaboti]